MLLSLRREEQTKLALSAAQLGLWNWERESGAMSWDCAMRHLYGLSSDTEITSISQFFERVHPEDVDRVHAAIEEAYDGGPGLNLQFRILLSHNSVRWIQTRGAILRDSSGKATGMTGVASNIDDQKALTGPPRSGQNEFHHIADSMPQLVWVSQPNGFVEWWNQRWYAYTGSTFAETKDEGWALVTHPEDLPRLWERWRQCLATGDPIEAQFRLRRHDGVYRWFLSRGTPVKDSAGRITRWFGTSTDIDDYKQAAAEVRRLGEQREERTRQHTADLAIAEARIVAKLQAILDSADKVSIIATDTAGVITTFNRGAEAMLQYRSEELIGLFTPECIHVASEMRERAQLLSEEFGRPISGMDVFIVPAQTGRFQEMEWTYVRKDGSSLDVSLALTAIRAGGEITGYLGIATDISGKKFLERELRDKNAVLLGELRGKNLILQEQTRRAEDANRAKSVFLATMSHEIRTPMNAILGMSDILWDSQLDADQRQYVEVFRRAGHVLLDLINSILDVSKIEAGHLELENAPFDLEDVVMRSVELLVARAQAKGILLLHRIAPDVQNRLIGDAGRLQQVLVNLLGNAVKFTDSGEIVLSVQPIASGEYGALEFSVSDTGIGIGRDQLDNVFNDFSQGDSSTTRKYGGTGLGLGICRRLVEAMGGNITVTSELGRGSVFHFTAAFLPGAEERLVPRDNTSDLHGLRVLIIDNNESNRLILRETLSAFGLMSVACRSAEEGALKLRRAAAHATPFSLIIMDRQMPGTDGFAAIPLLRATAPSIPIVMLTSDTRPGDAEKRRQNRVAGYAIKPVKRAALLQLICNALGTTFSGNPESSLLTDCYPDVGPRGPLRILIAEDSPDNRFLLQVYLRNRLYVLTFAENGKQAIELFIGGEFDLVLMDMQMPVMDGLVAASAIRNFERLHNRIATPIIALTANALAHESNASYTAGCDTHLSKPISRQKLLSAIEQCRRTPVAALQTDPLMIEVPEGLEEFVPRYLESRKQEVPVLLECLAASNFTRIREIAHDIKGTGASFGFEELTRLGEQLQSSAAKASEPEVAQQLQRLTEYLHSVRIPLGLQMQN